MITTWEMYWFTRLDGLNSAAISLFVIGAVAMIFCIVGFSAFVLDENDDMQRRIKPLLTVSILTTVVGAVVAIFVPTTKEMAAIKVIPMIANSEQMQKLGDVGNNMLDLANAWLLELKPKKDK